MLNTDERIGIARRVIECCKVKDEDLKQEIYMNALEFCKDPKSTKKIVEDYGEVMRVISQMKPYGVSKETHDSAGEYNNAVLEKWLITYLIGIIHTYEKEKTEYEARINLQGMSLDHMDYLILHYLCRTWF